jgi:hypothetical protein
MAVAMVLDNILSRIGIVPPIVLLIVSVAYKRTDNAHYNQKKHPLRQLNHSCIGFDQEWF